MKIDLILKDVSLGRPIIITDHEDRENEGDLMIAAELATEETLAFFARYARGIMCIPCMADRLNRFKIPMMYSNSNDKFSTPFANSIDSTHGVTTGVSVADRMKTLQVFLNEHSKPEDIAQPGHLFPLRAHLKLLEGRPGHTEASVTLCTLASLKPVAVICEIMNDDGSMMRGKELEEFGNLHHLNSISIDQIAERALG